MPDRSFLAWPFFEERHRALAEEVERCAAGRSADLDASAADVDATCRTLVGRLAEAGLLRHAVPAAYGGAHERLDVRSLCLVRETLARFAGLADFAFAMQGLGSGAITPVRHRGAAPRLSAGGRRRPQDRGVRAVRARGRLRRRGDRHHRRAGWRRLRPERRQDLDLERRHRRLLRRVRAHRRGAGRQGSVRLHRRCRHARASRSPSASRLIAPHPLATLRFEDCRVPRDAAARRARPGLQDRDGDARRVPPDRRRRGARLRAPRARRGARAREPAGSCSAGRSPSCR